MIEPPLLEMRAVSKRFETVVANRSVDLKLRTGEVHALLGQNGAGKTTLMSILAGLYQPDEGSILLDGVPVTFRTPGDAIAAGIGMVYQHFGLVDKFTVAENIHLGWDQTPRRTDLKTLAARTSEIADKFGLQVDPYAQVWQLSVGQQQRVEILRALSRGSRILILDEPTAVLTPQEAEELSGMLRDLAANGCTIVFISHKLGEVLAVSDCVTVLRDGSNVATLPIQSCDRGTLAHLMVGEQVPAVAKTPRDAGAVVVGLEDAWALNDRGLAALRGVDLDLREGELVGVAGVAGNGQKELAEVLTGLRRMTRGVLRVDGATIEPSPSACVAVGVASIPEDRLETAIIPSASVGHNAILREYRKPPICGRVAFHRHKANEFAATLLEEAKVSSPSLETPVGYLSGGNLQRLVVAREARIASRALVAANPTRGLDVGATEKVRSTLLELRDRGTAVLFISEDLEELLSLSDRLLVMYEGEIVGEFAAGSADRDQIGLLMAGAGRANSDGQGSGG